MFSLSWNLQLAPSPFSQQKNSMPTSLKGLGHPLQTPDLFSPHIMRIIAFCLISKRRIWASLVAQWSRILLPMQETWVRALILEDSTSLGATEPVCLKY